MRCWVCDEPASWKVTGEKIRRRGEPEVVVEFWACDRCVPFEAPVRKEEEARA